MKRMKNKRKLKAFNKKRVSIVTYLNMKYLTHSAEKNNFSMESAIDILSGRGIFVNFLQMICNMS